MGAATSVTIFESKPGSSPGQGLYWSAVKRQLPASAAEHLLSKRRTLPLLQRTYAALGGNSASTSSLSVKGGAAAWLHLRQELARLRPWLPSSLQDLPPVEDFDFNWDAGVFEVGQRARLALQDFSRPSERKKVEKFGRAWPAFQVRNDSQHGEAFFGDARIPMGAAADATEELPVKMSYCAELHGRRTGEEFRLVRLGVGLWHARLQRSTIASLARAGWSA